MRRLQRTLCILGILAMVIAGAYLTFKPKPPIDPQRLSQLHHPDTLVLLIPNANINPDLIQAWVNAAEEEGLHLQVMQDQAFKQKLNENHDYPGVILADQIHDKISLNMIESLRNYVRAGGYLMLIYSAATTNETGAYFEPQAPFSDVIGTPYAKYLTMGRSTISWSEAGQKKSSIAQLKIPPGKYIALEQGLSESPDDNTFYAISSYQYGALIYPHYTTEPESSDQNTLLSSVDGQIVAKTARYGSGRVLFINLPLTFFWLNTDRMLMHVFLRYFAIEMLNFPYLSIAPGGIGGLILDLQIPNKSSFDNLKTLIQDGLLQQGPFSMDFSAGPDSSTIGDKNGIDIKNDADARKTILELSNQGHDIGSLGGWNNNYFGRNVTDNNQQSFEPYIQMNQEALQALLDKPVTSYSSPLMNQPVWLSDTLSRVHFTAYNTAKNTGSAPYRGYENEKFNSEGLWSFPLVPFGKYQTFQEFYVNHLSQGEVATWLEDMVEFVSTQHAIRLLYTPVQGIEYYPLALKSWFALTALRQQQNRFRWYTMSGIAKFLTNRLKTKWTVIEHHGIKIIQASNVNSLEQQALFIKKSVCQKPAITEGAGTINEDLDNWIVIAGNTTTFRWECQSKILGKY